LAIYTIYDITLNDETAQQISGMRSASGELKV